MLKKIYIAMSVTTLNKMANFRYSPLENHLTEIPNPAQISIKIETGTIHGCSSIKGMLNNHSTMSLLSNIFNLLLLLIFGVKPI